MGFETGIDIEALTHARDGLARALPEETTYGAIHRAGLPRVISPA